MSLIYEPKGKAREYAALALSTYRGCDHCCIYCMAAAATHRAKEEFARVTTRGVDFLAKLSKEAAALPPTGERILLCFATDPYCHLDITQKVTREAIKILHSCGLNVQVLTKGGTRALRDLDLFSRADAFASTLTCLDDSESIKWEPGAALPTDRIGAIQEFHTAGIPTWVSLEPVLDPAISLEIIRRTHPFVDLFKVGKLNYHPLAREIDWTKFAQNAVELLAGLGKAYYVKKDLACFLPAGHPARHPHTVAE